MGIIATFVFTSDTETVTRTKLNNLVANLKTEFNGSIDNSNIKAAAGIVGSKLDLSTPGIIGGTSAAAGTFTDLTSTGDTTIGNASGDALTFHPNAWTLTNNVTITGTWTDLGTVTTVDINGGTLDSVQIGGTTATGELIVNDSSDNANGLGSQGSSTQVLTSAGAGANPTWETPNKSYSTAWISVANDTSYGAYTHNLGTINFLYSIFWSASSNGANAQSAISSAGGGGMDSGTQLHTITTTQFSFRTGADALHGTFVSGTTTGQSSGYIRVVLLALE